MKMIIEFLDWNGNLYQVIRTIRESQKPNINVWKEHLIADAVLRREDILFFCRKVEDVQIIEDKPETPEIPKSEKLEEPK